MALATIHRFIEFPLRKMHQSWKKDKKKKTHQRPNISNKPLLQRVFSNKQPQLHHHHHHHHLNNIEKRQKKKRYEKQQPGMCTCEQWFEFIKKSLSLNANTHNSHQCYTKEFPNHIQDTTHHSIEKNCCVCSTHSTKKKKTITKQKNSIRISFLSVFFQLSCICFYLNISDPFWYVLFTFLSSHRLSLLLHSSTFIVHTNTIFGSNHFIWWFVIFQWATLDTFLNFYKILALFEQTLIF